MTDSERYAHWLARAADYHEAHGGLVEPSPRAAARYGIPTILTVSEARYAALLLVSHPSPEASPNARKVLH